VDAYHLQLTWVTGVYGVAPAGYKAGLTNPAAQARFGIDTPVVGVLPEVAHAVSGAEFHAAPGLLIEVEIGLLVGRDGAPAAMVGVVELPKLSFAAPELLDRNDVIAANVSAYRFVTGSSTLFDPAVRDVSVVLERDGEVLNRAYARDAMGDPVAAYQWMMRKLRAVGYRIDPGMVLLTGALGRVVDGVPGRYTARFDGALGSVDFRIVR
jgi:2-keto-4-pentenoate hydratase